MIKHAVIIFSLLLIFPISLKADIAPDDGYERVKINLVTETTEDLTDYRFFLDFYGDLREVEIKSNGRTEIPSTGGGARYSSGTLVAIPKMNLKDYDGKLSANQSENLSRAIKNKEIETVELAKHRFSMDVPKGEKPAEVYYVIKRAENTLKAERITEEKPALARSFLPASRVSYVIAGILFTLAVLAAGVFAFRKAAKKV